MVVPAPPRNLGHGVLTGRVPGRSFEGMRALLFVRVIRETRYLLLGLHLSLVSFALVSAGLALGAGTAVLLAGLVVLSGTLVLARGFAHLERLRLSDLYGRPVVRLPYRGVPARAGTARRLLTPLTCGRSWSDVLHALLYPIPATIGAVLAAAWWALALGGLLYPLWGWTLYLVPGYTEVGRFLLPESPALATLAVYLVGGLLFALTLPMALRVLAWTSSSLSRLLLLAPEEVTARVLTSRERNAGAGGEKRDTHRRRYVSARQESPFS